MLLVLCRREELKVLEPVVSGNVVDVVDEIPWRNGTILSLPPLTVPPKLPESIWNAVGSFSPVPIAASILEPLNAPVISHPRWNALCHVTRISRCGASVPNGFQPRVVMTG
jgi:hypothetical protein